MFSLEVLEIMLAVSGGMTLAAMFLRFLGSQNGILLIFLALIIGGTEWVYNEIWGPMNDRDVPRFVTATPLDWTANGNDYAVSITNNNPSWDTPDNLWIGCLTSVRSGRQLVMVYQAEPKHDYNGNIVPQKVPPKTTSIINFNVLPFDFHYRLDAGATLDSCVVGATQKQALAMNGMREDMSDSQRLIDRVPVQPVQTAPVQTAPVQTAPVQTAPVQTNHAIKDWTK
jgi:hypothetical protein